MLRTTGLVSSPIFLNITAQVPIAFGEVPGKEIKQDFAADGSQFAINNHSYKMRVEGSPSADLYAKLSIDRLLLTPLLEAVPFASLSTAQLSLAEDQEVRGVDCICVEVLLEGKKQRWYLAKQDSLPRAYEIDVSAGGSQRLEVFDLQVHADLHRN